MPNLNNNRTSTSKAFVQSGSDLSIDYDGRQLVAAARANNIEKVRVQLKENNVNVDAIDEVGDTALHVAASKGLSRMVRYLLLHGADVELKNKVIKG